MLFMFFQQYMFQGIPLRVCPRTFVALVNYTSFVVTVACNHFYQLFIRVTRRIS